MNYNSIFDITSHVLILSGKSISIFKFNGLLYFSLINSLFYINNVWYLFDNLQIVIFEIIRNIDSILEDVVNQAIIYKNYN